MTVQGESGPAADSLISKEEGLRYWEGVNPDVDGMLGGIPAVTRVDLQGSRNFLAKLGFGSKSGLRTAKSALEGGAGIGRITEGLLSGVATEIDVVEPIAKFTATLEAKKINGVRNIYTMGLEEWADVRAQPELQYDLIWVQWCVGHLTDDQLVRFLDRCRAVLNADGVIVLKENLSTNGADAHDEVDSSVTRQDESFRRLFQQAKLRLVKTDMQRGLNHAAGHQLLPVRMYALKPN